MDPNFLPLAYFDGKLVPYHEATVPLATHGLQYGTTVFSGMRVLGGEGRALVFRLDEHTKRLARGARLLFGEMDRSVIADAVLLLVKATRATKLTYLRPFIYAATQTLIPSLHTSEKKLAIYGFEFSGTLPLEGVTLTFSSYPRVPDASIPGRGKIGGAYWTSSAAKSEAQLRGFDDALLLNAQGKLAEGSGMNVFLVRDGRMITPDLQQDILDGITRDSVITLAKHAGISVEERVVDRSEVWTADEIFLTGTAAGLASVTRIEHQTFPTDRPVTNQLRDLFAEASLGELAGFESWVTRVAW